MEVSLTYYVSHLHIIYYVNKLKEKYNTFEEHFNEQHNRFTKKLLTNFKMHSFQYLCKILVK